MGPLGDWHCRSPTASGRRERRDYGHDGNPGHQRREREDATTGLEPGLVVRERCRLRGGLVGGIEPNPDNAGPLADAALDGNAGQLELGHYAGRKIDTRGTQLGIAHRSAGRLTQRVKHQLLLVVTSFKCGRRRTGFGAGVPGSPGGAVREELGAQDQPPGLTDLGPIDYPARSLTLP